MEITANLFKDMITSAANNLSNNKDEIDRLNVFPVPDGDTGKNMFLTMNGASNFVKTATETDLPTLTQQIASATLKSARGNSGVILSQLFRGFSKAITSNDITPEMFANAFKSASDAAYKAVMKPTEGTILTVAREGAEAAVKSAAQGKDILGIAEDLLDGANKSLQRTPELLPKLKEAGVVDSGGMGWVCILEGLCHTLRTGEIIANNDGESTSKQPDLVISSDNEEITFGYCTEFIIEKKNLEVSADGLRNTLSKIGDCLLVIEDFDIIKVHVHTDNPGTALTEAIKLGSLINIKIDNMRYQHNETISSGKANEGSSKEDAATKAEPKPYSIISISSGEGFSTIFSELGVSKIVEGGQTMNPSAGDIADAISAENADVVYLLPNNKNIILAAEQSKLMVDCKVHIIPTTTIPQGIAAVLAFDPEADDEENAANMNEARTAVKTGLITYAVRDSESDGVVIKEGDIIGIADKKIITSTNDINAAAKDVCSNICDDDTEVITLYYGDEMDKDQAEALTKELSDTYDSCDVYLQYGGQAVYYYIISAE